MRLADVLIKRDITNQKSDFDNFLTLNLQKRHVISFEGTLEKTENENKSSSGTVFKEIKEEDC